MKNYKRHPLSEVLLSVCGVGAIAFPAIGLANNSDNMSDIILEEVIVTAQKRSENIQDVPVTVTNVSEQRLEQQNITNINQLSRAVPSLSSNGGVRGVATGGFVSSSEQAVSYVLDGVVMGRTVGDNLGLYDVERIEVLSGPQGMLFGKNASAGVINIVTRAPSTEMFEASVSAEFGNYEYEREQLMVNVPLTSNAAMRVSLHNSHDGGLVSNVLTGNDFEKKSRGIRSKFLWEPNNNLSVNVIADWEENSGSGEQAFVHSKTDSPFVLSQLQACGITAKATNTKNCSEGVASVTADENIWGLSTQIEYEFENGFTITSITSKRYRELGDFDYVGKGNDSDFFSTNVLSTNLTPSEHESFTQEIRLTSPVSDHFEFVAGLYYFDNEDKKLTVQGGRLGPIFGAILDAGYYPGAETGRAGYTNVEQDGWAAFGQATIHLTEDLSLIVAGRWDDESLSQEVDALTPADLFGTYGFVYLPGFSDTIVDDKQSVDSDNFSWRLGVKYDWTEDLMSFFTISEGYKGPAVNDIVSGGDPIITPEYPTNYELGIKANLFNHQIFAAATLFYTKVEDYQTTVWVPSSPSNPVPGFAQGNASHIETKGLDLSVFGKLTESLSFNLGLIYIDAEYADDFLVGCSPAQTPGVGSCSVDNTTSPVDHLQRVSDWRILLGAEYTKPLSWGEFYFQPDFTYESGYSTSSSPDPVQTLGDKSILNARIGFRSADDNWDVSIWGRNLLDKAYPMYSPNFLSGFYGDGASYISQPSTDNHMTYGVSLKLKY